MANEDYHLGLDITDLLSTYSMYTHPWFPHDDNDPLIIRTNKSLRRSTIRRRKWQKQSSHISPCLPKAAITGAFSTPQELIDNNLRNRLF